MIMLSTLKRASIIGLLTLVAALSLKSNAFAHDGNQALAAVVLDRSADKRARDSSRHPVQTLSLFHVEPGMKVAEALPGGGWYSEILANYLGSDGALYGINYNRSMWPLFGIFSDERIEQMAARTDAFPSLIAELTDNGITSDGFTFASVPNELSASLDRVLFVRALHNLARFEADAGTLTEAINASYKLLKEDGLVGVVQHRAPEESDDTWASGAAGYLKQSMVVSAFEKAGFELIAQSEVNANRNDNPTPEDNVWRLPPSLNGSADDPEKRAQYETIGESDRMTLVFKKKGTVVEFH